VIRRALPADADEIGRVFVAARNEMAYLPRIPHEIRPKLGAWFVGRDAIWVEERAGRVVGFVGLNDGEVTHLYVEPEAQGEGLGTALLEHVQALSAGRLWLWVFQRNEGARRLYERHGFRLLEVTDGAGNMEREPDARYEWRAENRHASGTDA
jgi:GNAT superfamily N-acetyltransferase